MFLQRLNKRRMIMSKLWYPMINQSECVGCLACYNNSKHSVFSIENDKPKVVNREGCVEGCHGCGNLCPCEGNCVFRGFYKSSQMFLQWWLILIGYGVFILFVPIAIWLRNVIACAKSEVIDTDFSKGQLTNIQNVKYDDLVKFHGHSCDGLLGGMQALQVGLKVLYPVIDRTNTRIISRSSPCLTDATIYLTGGRYQYNTFYVTDSIPGIYIIRE